MAPAKLYAMAWRIMKNSIARGALQDCCREFDTGICQCAGRRVQAPTMVPSRRNRRRLTPRKNIRSSGTSSMPPTISGMYAAGFVNSVSSILEGQVSAEPLRGNSPANGHQKTEGVRHIASSSRCMPEP